VKWLTQNFSGRIVFISTCSVYGAQDDLNLTESSSVAPLSLYAYTKLQSEEHLKNSNALIFRLGTLFGVSDTYSRVRMDLVVNTMTARAHATGRISVFGGEQYRPLMHVRDVAQVIASNFDGEHTGIYNIANENIKIHDLALRIKQFFDKVEIQVTNMPFEDTRNYVVSSDKAKKELIFDPQLSVDFGIEQIKELLQNRRIKDLHAMRYSNQLFLKDVLPQQSTTHKWKSLNS
jgi:nucleoside-diphosphate-sugar epimerase